MYDEETRSINVAFWAGSRLSAPTNQKGRGFPRPCLYPCPSSTAAICRVTSSISAMPSTRRTSPFSS